LRQLSRAARDLSLGTLVEAHDAKELEQALAVEPTAVGINSRDLTTFMVDLGVAMSVLARVPTYIPAVAESGIETRADVERLAAAGADLVLVGSSVARAVEPRASVEALCGVQRTGGKRV